MSRIVLVRAEVNKPAYAYIPRAILEEPPIAHRHTKPSREYLSPFEFGVMVAIMVAATRAWFEDIHVHARQAGGKRIKDKKDKIARYREQMQQYKNARRQGLKVRAPKPPFSGWDYEFGNIRRLDGKRLVVRKALKWTGSKGYHHHFKKERHAGPPDIVKTTVARRPLLMSVGLPVNGRSRARLKFALDRLRQPIAGRSPLLIDYTLRSGRVQLAVAGEWLKVKKGKYKRVLLPLPLKSPTALALFLFLHAINTSPINDTDIRLDRLYARLGIATSKKKGHADFSYTLNRALKAVNDHVNRLDDKVLQAANLEVPAGYEIKARRGDGRIRFEALPRQLPDDEEREYLQSQRKAQETLDEAEHQEERPRLIRRQRPREEVEPEEKQERPRGPVVTQLVRELEQLQTEMKPRVWEPWV